jgi:hypothetical protein
VGGLARAEARLNVVFLEVCQGLLMADFVEKGRLKW